MKTPHVHEKMIKEWAEDTSRVVEALDLSGKWMYNQYPIWGSEIQYRFRHKHQDLIDQKAARPELIVEFYDDGGQWHLANDMWWPDVEYRLVEPRHKHQDLIDRKKAQPEQEPVTCQIYGHIVGHCVECNVGIEKEADDAINETNHILATRYLSLKEQKLTKSEVHRLAIQMDIFPPQRQPLTNEQIDNLLHRNTALISGELGINLIAFARAVEAAHNIKEIP